MFKHLVASTIKRQKFTINCTRKASIGKKSLRYEYFIKFDEYHELLMDNLGIKSHEAERILQHQQIIFDIPKSHLVKQCQLCIKFQIDVRALSENASFLGWSEHQLESRILLLKEMGARYISSTMLANFVCLMHVHIGLFKAYTLIPKPVNIAENLVRHLGTVPEYVFPIKQFNDHLILEIFNRQCAALYLAWLLNVSPNEKEILYRLSIIGKHRSFVLMKDLLKYLYNDIGLTRNQIIEHSCVKHGSVKDLRRIVEDVKTYGGIEIRKLIRQNPIFHKLQYENTVKVIALLEKHNFSKRVMQCSPEILLIPEEELAWRLKNFDTMPELEVLKKSEKSLKAIISFVETWKRMGYLNHLNIKDITVNTFTCQEASFEKFTREGLDKMKGREICDCFKDRLKLDPQEIKRRIAKHPYWNRADLTSMNETLEFLLSRFSLDAIQDNIQMILYSRKKVEETLKELPEFKERAENEKEFVHSDSQILSLALYVIEREFGFSGDGIWREDTSLPGQCEETVKNSNSEFACLSDSDLSDSDSSEFEETEETKEDDVVHKEISA